MIMKNQIIKKIPIGYKQTEIGVIPDDWDIEPIKQLALIITGSKNTQDRVSEGLYPFFVRSQKIERINSYSYDGEAVLTAGDGVGTGKVFHYINGKFDIHQRVYKISDFNEKLNGYFFFLYFSKNFFKRIVRMTAKSSVDSVRMEMIADMQIPIPIKTEQIAIATVLFDTDALIEKLEKLIAKKKAIKQGTMQQLLTGKKRLPGFSGEWKVKKLGKFGFDISDGNYSSKYPKASEFKEIGVAFIRANNIKHLTIVDGDLRFISKELHSELTKGHLKQDDILITTRGEIGQVAIVPKRYIGSNINAQIVRINVNNKINKNYLAYFLLKSETQEKILSLQTGSALKQLPIGKLMELQIIYPNINEQTAIATILSDMDAEIESLEQKRDKYIMLKQGMMQQLLTGRIRLYANN